MKKFIKINLILIRNAWVRDSKISGYILSQILLQAFDVFVSVAFIKIVFLVSPQVGGWNIYELLFLFSYLQLVGTLNSSWLKRGVNSMAEEMIRMGEYDFYLTKPYDTLTLVSISKPRIYTMAKFFMYLAIMIYALSNIGGLPLVNYLWLGFLFVNSFLLFHAMRVLIVTPVFWTIRASSLTDVMDRMMHIMRYPATIYPRVLMLIFSTVFPILVISYFPVRSVLFQPDLRYIIYVVAITIIFNFLSRFFWNLGEKNYSSASS